MDAGGAHLVLAVDTTETGIDPTNSSGNKSKMVMYYRISDDTYTWNKVLPDAQALDVHMARNDN